MPHKRAHEKRDVVFAFAQWRHGDANDIEPKEEIVPEFPLADKALEIFVRRGDCFIRNSGADFALARYNSDGSPDRAFEL
jgi:hypothetical protein